VRCHHVRDPSDHPQGVDHAKDDGQTDASCFSAPDPLTEGRTATGKPEPAVGHGPHQKKLVPGKRDVAVVKAEPVGRYAVRLTFDDGHSSGIYSWRYLRELGEEAEARLSAYAAALEGAGLSRG
jgi:hypothetical protein